MAVLVPREGNQASAAAVGICPTARAIKMMCAVAPSWTLEQRLPDALTSANLSRVILTLAVGFAWAHRFSWAGGFGTSARERGRGGAWAFWGEKTNKAFNCFLLAVFNFFE